MSWDGFDERLEVGPYVLGWPDLVAFAEWLVQVMDGEIAAAFEGVEIAKIQAFDSSEWTVSIQTAEVSDLDARIARLLEGES